MAASGTCLSAMISISGFFVRREHLGTLWMSGLPCSSFVRDRPTVSRCFATAAQQNWSPHFHRSASADSARKWQESALGIFDNYFHVFPARLSKHTRPQQYLKSYCVCTDLLVIRSPLATPYSNCRNACERIGPLVHSFWYCTK